MQATFAVRVTQKTKVAQDICAFELAAADGTSLPPFAAGSHIDVHIPGGWTRQYSLCNPPAESHRYLIGVLREHGGRGGSRALHDDVDEGDILQVSSPKNHFALVHEATRSILVAGGIGVTPILSMAERLQSSGADFELHYCVRSRERAAFLDRLEKGHLSARLHLHVSDPAAGQAVDFATLLSDPHSDTHLYFCGPKGFMDAILATAKENRWNDAQIHYEYFAGASEKLDSDGSFEVKIASSGKVIVVNKDVTVTDALLGAGIEIETSCEQGVCGTCLTRVLSGTPDHRDVFLTADEHAANNQFLPCCSRALTPQLVLDL